MTEVKMMDDINNFIYSFSPAILAVASLIGTVVAILFVFPLETINKKVADIWKLLGTISSIGTSIRIDEEKISKMEETLAIYESYNEKLNELGQRVTFRKKKIPAVIDIVFFLVLSSIGLYFISWCCISYQFIGCWNYAINLFLGVCILLILSYGYCRFLNPLKEYFKSEAGVPNFPKINELFSPNRSIDWNKIGPHSQSLSNELPKQLFFTFTSFECYPLSEYKKIVNLSMIIDVNCDSDKTVLVCRFPFIREITNLHILVKIKSSDISEHSFDFEKVAADIIWNKQPSILLLETVEIDKISYISVQVGKGLKGVYFLKKDVENGEAHSVLEAIGEISGAEYVPYHPINVYRNNDSNK